MITNDEYQAALKVCRQYLREQGRIVKELSPISPPVDASLEGFEDFWDAYGKKVGREKCEAKWKRLKPADRDKILEYVPAYVRHTPNRRFRKNPLTFLNGKGWEDELPEVKGATVGDIGNPDYYD